MALMKLQGNTRAEELQFWGKVTGKYRRFITTKRKRFLNQTNIGLNADYYIAVAYTFTGMYEFPNKKFYWALSKDFEFSEMPDLNDQHKVFINNASGYFEGNPKKKLVSLKKEGEEGEGDGAGAEKAEEGGEEGDGAKKA